MTKPAWRRVIDGWRVKDPDRFEDWSERAALMEYDGGLPREEAERMAFELLCDKGTNDG